MHALRAHARPNTFPLTRAFHSIQVCVFACVCVRARVRVRVGVGLLAEHSVGQ